MHYIFSCNANLTIISFLKTKTSITAYLSGHFLDILVRLLALQRRAEHPVEGVSHRLLSPANQEQRQENQHGGGGGGTEEGGDGGELHLWDF